MPDTTIARSELILGGQKSGKTARAERLAAAWLARSPAHQAVYLATACAADTEMRERIARHRRDRALRVPAMRTVEAARELPQALAEQSHPGTLVVVDCLTLWLTAWLMPADGSPGEPPPVAALLQSLREARGPMVLVSNEIGLGVIPLGREVRAFVDALGTLNQQVAQACSRVTLMAAGLPLSLREEETP